LRHYLESLANFVLLKGLVDLTVSAVLVAVFYSLASVLSRLVPDGLLPISLDARTAAVLLAFVYLIAITLTASFRLYYLVRRDIRNSITNHAEEGKTNHRQIPSND